MTLMKKVGFLVLAVTLVLGGLTVSAVQPVSAGEADSGFTASLYLPFMQAPQTPAVDAARFVDEAGPIGDSNASELIYISRVHPANACNDLAGDYVYGGKIDGAPTNQTYTLELLTVTIENSDSDGKYFDWNALDTSGLAVGAVVVKAGRGGNAYYYTGGVTSDTGLHAPGFDKKGTFIVRQISNVTFCLVEAQISY